MSTAMTKGMRCFGAWLYACRSTVRGKGKAYRWGSGDELVALLINHTADEAVAVAERIKSAVAALTFEQVDHPITVSIGVASHPELADGPDELRARADEALRMAKEAGKNQVRVYPDPRTPTKPKVFASEEEIANVLRYVTSSSIDVRRDGIKDLLKLTHREELHQTEEVLVAIETLLSDADEEVRVTALQVVLVMIDREHFEAKLMLVDRYYQQLVNSVQNDPSPVVRNKAMVTIGHTGSPKFVGLILGWIRAWDSQIYGKVHPYVALTQLARAGLGAHIKNELRDALEKEKSEDVKQRLRECLKEVNSVIH